MGIPTAVVIAALSLSFLMTSAKAAVGSSGGSLTVVEPNKWYDGPVLLIGSPGVIQNTSYTIKSSPSPYILTTEICQVGNTSCLAVTNLSGSSSFFNGRTVGNNWKFRFRIDILGNAPPVINKVIDLHSILFTIP